MPDQSERLPAVGWLTDKIISPPQDARHWADRNNLRLDTKEPYLRIHFVSVYVSDQDRSMRFFVDQLGFTLISDTRFASGNRWVEVAPPDGTAVLALVLPRPGWDEERFVGHSGLVTFLTEDVDATVELWSKRSVTFTIPPQTPAWGGTFCRFEDPDGNAFVLVGFDQLTRDIDARRRALAERIEADQRAAQELEIAKQVQARLFPQRLPHISGLDYAGICLQARSVGGDYYDFLELGTDRLALIIGDIAGKGMAGALLMANLQANLRSQCISAAERPAEFLGSVNRMLFQNTASNAYATLLFAEFDPNSGSLRYANCGHLAALVLRSDGSLDRLGPTCTVIGLFQNWHCSIAENWLNEGDVLVLYTDGVTESFNDAEEDFGEDRLVDAVRLHRSLPANELAQALVAEVLNFSAREQYDDITLIVAKRIPS